MTIADRIKKSIDSMEQGDIEESLTQVCIAIDITVKNLYELDRSSGQKYKEFISEYMWLISYMGIPTLMASTIRVPLKHKDVKSDSNGCCGIEDVIFHIIRCKLIHSTGPGSSIIWGENPICSMKGEGLVLSKNLVWGLIGSVVFCPINKNESIDESYWISVDDFKFFIQEVWGRIDLAVRVIKLNNKILDISVPHL